MRQMQQRIHDIVKLSHQDLSDTGRQIGSLTTAFAYLHTSPRLQATRCPVGCYKPLLCATHCLPPYRCHSFMTAQGQSPVPHTSVPPYCFWPFVTAWIAAASASTFLVLTPAMEMRPFLVM